MRAPLLSLLFLFSIILNIEAQTTSNITQQESLPCLNKKFSVLAHIVLDSLGNPNLSEGAVTGAVTGLNDLFSPICVSFEVCEFRYIENFQYDSIKAGTTPLPNWDELQIKYHQNFRINMFFPEVIVRNNDPSVAGFASLGGIGNPNNGGLVITKGGLGSIPHEMGHFFGLPHTFEGGGELADGSNCDSSGDGICDTPADPGDPNTNPPETLIDGNCLFISELKDANGDFYSPDVSNIMSYYGCDCDRFTYQQYLRMANTYLGSPVMW